MRNARLLGAVRPLVLLGALTLLLTACADDSGGGTSGGGGAEGYPDRNITVVVPFSAGGPTDTVTRLIADPMSKKLGVQIVVQNVEGAGGTVAAGEVSRAKPDGYTVLMHHIGITLFPYTTLFRSRKSVV